MKIQILIDNKDNEYNKYVDNLVGRLMQIGHAVNRIDDYKKVEGGEILLILSCEKIIPNYVLSRNMNNIVVHASDLPKGRGWHPLDKQVLEGKNEIPICLFEAVEKVDSGKVYLRDTIFLDGTELYEELKKKQAKKVNDMVVKYVLEYPLGKEQVGKPTYYKKFSSKNYELSLDKTIRKQFNLLRISNANNPAYFYHKNIRYEVNIKKCFQKHPYFKRLI